MTIQRMIELLEIEHECILRNSHGECDRNCGDCDLVQDDGDLHEMYTDVISLLKQQEPKPVVITTNAYGTKFYRCPNCNKNFYEPWELYKDYCYVCGQAVKWNE